MATLLLIAFCLLIGGVLGFALAAHCTHAYWRQELIRQDRAEAFTTGWQELTGCSERDAWTRVTRTRLDRTA